MNDLHALSLRITPMIPSDHLQDGPLSLAYG